MKIHSAGYWHSTRTKKHRFKGDIRMKKVFYNKKGMSLMEILVGSLMFAMIAVTVSAVLAPMMMSFSRAADFAEYNTLLDNVGNRIASDLAKSSGIPTDLGELDRVGISI